MILALSILFLLVLSVCVHCWDFYPRFRHAVLWIHTRIGRAVRFFFSFWIAVCRIMNRCLWVMGRRFRDRSKLISR